MESPLINKSWTRTTNTLAIVYPNLYYGGVYCLAPNIIYNITNNIKNWICKRQFLDKHEDLSKFDLVGFTFQYELDLNNIKRLIKEHKPKITFAGGPVVNSNPNLIKDLVDFLVIGEVELVLPEILKHYGKKDFLKRISKIKGVYVKGISKKFEFTESKDLNLYPYPLYQPFPDKIDKTFTFGKPFILEIERGCPFRCKFCILTNIHKNVRYRTLKNIKEIIDKGIKLNKRNKILIYSPSFTHPKRKEILKHLIKNNLTFSVPSTKIEFMDEELLKLIKQGGQKTITIAPEANQRLRKLIGKTTTDEQFIKFIKLIKKLKFKKLKVYLMLGLPGQTEKDIKETIELINKFKSIFNNISLSINFFIPKKLSLFKNFKFNKKVNKQQKKLIKKNLKVKYKISNLNTSYQEYKLANA